MLLRISYGFGYILDGVSVKTGTVTVRYDMTSTEPKNERIIKAVRYFSFQ